MNKIKIISDGTAAGTQVHAGGVKLTGITKIEILPILLGDVLFARITFAMPELDIEAGLADEACAT